MPQPVKSYSDMRTSAFAISLHPNTSFAHQFSTIVCQWTATEIEMSKLALDILGLHGEAALPLYLTLQSGKTQRDAIEALVRANMNPDRISDFEETWRRLSSSRNQRNTVVHGIWALSNDFPDDMILVDHAEILTRHAVESNYIETRDATRLLDIGPRPKSLTRYSTKDFGDIIRRIHGARFSLSMFRTGHPLPKRES